MPPDSLRVAAEERRNAHRKPDGVWRVDFCRACGKQWPCADRRFAELVITTLNEAEIEKWWDNETEHNYQNPIFYRLVPDPGSVNTHAD